MNVRFAQPLTSESPRRMSPSTGRRTPPRPQKGEANMANAESRLADRHTDHETVNALNGFAAYLERDEGGEDSEDGQPERPEDDPFFRRIAALERACRFEDADSLLRQRDEEDGLLADDEDDVDYGCHI